jgi:hypothetical protein
MSDTDKSLQTIEPTSKALTYKDMYEIGKTFVASTYFGSDLDKISKAITKIMAGQELGVPPFASMRGINVIEGSPELSANLMASKIKASGKYDYEVVQKDSKHCKLRFIEIRGNDRVTLGEEEFNQVDACTQELMDPTCTEAPLKHNTRQITRYKRGGGTYTIEGCLCKDNWRKSPKAMFFARALSAGARTYCPDVFNGIAIYATDEITEAKEPPAREAIEAEIVTKPPADESESAQGSAAEESDAVDASDSVAEFAHDAARATEDHRNAGIPLPDPIDRSAVTDALVKLGLNNRGITGVIKTATGKLSMNKLDDEGWANLDMYIKQIEAGEAVLDPEWYEVDQ